MIDLSDLRPALRDRATDVAEMLLGPPTQRGRSEWRWGKRGSFALVVAGERRGQWFDHEAGEGGDLLALVQRERGGGFPEAVAWAHASVGDVPEPPRRRDRQTVPERDTAALALELWHAAAESIAGTPAESYLLRRGIDPNRLPGHTGRPMFAWPAALRWHAGRRALIVAVNCPDTGLVRAVQTIALRPDGAPVLRDGRKTKLTYGPLRGRAARFGWNPPADGRWALAEGAETALAAASILRSPVWASLGAANFAHVAPPAWAVSATIIADHDPTGLCVARKAAERLGERMPVTVLTPERLGLDAADLTKERAA